MEAEFSRMIILYAHLIACCVAIGSIATSDMDMIKHLLKTTPGQLDEGTRHLRPLQRTVSRALWALWITGFAIIALDMADKGVAYLGNPKLQAKIAIVMLLTLNGAVLHRYVMPAMERAGSVLRLPFSQRQLAILAGTISGVSWLYAAMLGIGRPLAWKYSLAELMAAYPLLIVGGFTAMTLLVAWASFSQGDEVESNFEASRMAGAGS